MIDFLIIGGGIAGLSAAARISPLGSVLVVEAEDALGYHASGRSAAMYIKSYGNEVVCALNVASEEFLSTCADGKGVLSPRGFMFVGNADQRHHIDEVCKSADTREISIDEAASLVPIINKETAKFAALVEDAPDLDTDLLMQECARMARANGAQIRTKATVQSITRTKEGWQVQLAGNGASDGEVLEARNLVDAAGAWADRVAEMAGLPGVGLTPKRRSVARIPAPDDHDVSGWPMMVGAAEDWYAKPDAGKFMISPAEADPMEPHDAFADDMVLAEGIARYQAMVTPEVTRLETSWAGLRTFAPDDTLVLGPDPLDRSFIWCAGQGGYGFQSSGGASAVLRATITGETAPVSDVYVRALIPDRFGNRA